MARKSATYICDECGTEASKWSGKCVSCGAWNSLIEARENNELGSLGKKLITTKLGEAKTNSSHISRYTTGISSLDELLGGGLVPGSVVLLAGQPGIGKSTILLQIADELAAKNKKVLYASGEESIDQISLRASRLGANSEAIELANTTSADNIASSISSRGYDVSIVDSIQTTKTNSVSSSPGSPSQLTMSTKQIISAAKQSNTATIIVGHVTKEGSIAGPKIIEHLVDVVLHIEGDRYGGFKIIRSVKNRFGSTNDLAIFEMTTGGMQMVENPSAALLQERQVSDGSVVLATVDGSQPLLVEVQALVNKTSFGYPKRTASGFDLNRLNILVAVISQRTKLNLNEYDVFLNIVGGIRVHDPGADLAVCMAIASAAKGMQLSEDGVVFGEVGLSGEVRRSQHADKRIAEANKIGFKLSIGPKLGRKNSFHNEVTSLKQALNQYLSK